GLMPRSCKKCEVNNSSRPCPSAASHGPARTCGRVRLASGPAFGNLEAQTPRETLDEFRVQLRSDARPVRGPRFADERDPGLSLPARLAGSGRAAAATEGHPLRL